MGFSHTIVFIFAVVGGSLAFTAEYVPKSYYVIHEGVQSPVVFLRAKRSFQNSVPLVRMRRSDSGQSGGSGGSSGSFSSSGSFAGSSAGAGDGVYFPEHFAAGLEAVKKLSGFPGGFPDFAGGIPGGIPSGNAYGSASGSAYPSGGAGAYGNGIAPDLHARFGGDDGVSYSGSAEGARGVYSASSSSIDGDGNVKYSVKTGKF